MAEGVGSDGMSDAEPLARVSALVARAGLRLPADQIAGLVTAYRTDRIGFEWLRAMLAAQDETARTCCGGRPARPPDRVAHAYERAPAWHARRAGLRSSPPEY